MIVCCCCRLSMGNSRGSFPLLGMKIWRIDFGSIRVESLKSRCVLVVEERQLRQKMMEVVLWVYTLVCIPHRQFHAEGATMCIQLI